MLKQQCASYKGKRPLGRKSMQNQPIIAVLAQNGKTKPSPYAKYLGRQPINIKDEATEKSYIVYSQVRFLEESGAKVVPIPTSMSDDEIERIFSRVNGVYFPSSSGSRKLGTSGYGRTARKFFEKAIEANDKGDYFPVWGTSLGMETMMHLTAENSKRLLESLEMMGVKMPLRFTEEARASRMFCNLPKKIMKRVGSESVNSFYHDQGVSWGRFKNTRELSEFMKVLSWNKSMIGRPYVSTVEAYHYPFYGVQWQPVALHPYRVQQQQQDSPPSSSSSCELEENVAIQAGMAVCKHVGEFFIKEARKNKHRVNLTKMEKLLIDGYSPQFTLNSFERQKVTMRRANSRRSKEPIDFEQCYFFD